MRKTSLTLALIYLLQVSPVHAALPSITSISPNSGPTSGGTQVTITGTNFSQNMLARIGGAQATSVTFVNSTTLRILTGPNQSGTNYTVTVTNEDGQTGADVSAFAYVAPVGTVAPTLTSISPNTGPYSGGTLVTITGTGFVAGIKILVGANKFASNVTVVNPTTITATMPASLSGSTLITVLTPHHKSNTLGYDYTLPAPLPAPTLISVSPTSGPAIGGTVITVTGTNIADGFSLTVGGTTLTNLEFINSTTIRGTVPPLLAGAKTFVLFNPDLVTARLTSAYTAVSPTGAQKPVISNVSPNTGPREGGTGIRIIGQHFQSGATVRVGNKFATDVTFVSSTEIRATTPSNPSGGSTYIYIANPDGQDVLAENIYGYDVPPATAAGAPEQKPYPNPYRMSQTSQPMTFSTPGSTSIKIYTMAGELVRGLTPNSNGDATWDIKNGSGELVASGVYVALIEGADEKKYKLVIER